jgi:molybdopterin-guanine dinucleotide biosynthesis protein A
VSAAPLGAVLAGGRSTRYGSPKALALVGGTRIVDRVIIALRAATADVVLIANDSALASAIDLPCRSDALPGLGALGGVHTALLWAREEDRAGIVGVACDMPFLSAPLLQQLRERAQSGADVVIPQSGGRRGVEPLCAYYGTGCIGAIEAAAAAGDQRMIGFHEQVRVVVIPLREVNQFGEPDELFLNVNTPEDRERAERIAQRIARAGHDEAANAGQALEEASEGGS